MPLSEAEELELLTLKRQRAMQQQAPSEPPPPLQEKAMNLLKGAVEYSPWGIAAKGLETASGYLDKAAYNAGGAATDLAAKVLPAERTNPLQYMIPTAPDVGFMANLGTQIAPTLLGGEAAKLSSPAVQSFARSLVQSAIKPPRATLETGKAQQAINTILEKNIPTSESGLADVAKQSRSLDQRVTNFIAGSDAKVSTPETARHLVNEIKALDNVSMASDKRNKLTAKLEEYLAENPESMSVQRAHELKKGNYTEVGNRPYMATQDANTALEDQIRMAVARGQREATIKAVPETAPLLNEQSQLQNVLKIAGPKLLMEGNRNPLSFGSFSPSLEKLAMWLIDRDAASKGLIARNLYQGSERIPQTLAQIMAAAAIGYNNNPPALSPEGYGALYAPPLRGSPDGRRGGGTR